ncbi:MAG: hypothetical protein ABSF34_22740 [Verrucomicrobiota bacterium]
MAEVQGSCGRTPNRVIHSTVAEQIDGATVTGGYTIEAVPTNCRPRDGHRATIYRDAENRWAKPAGRKSGRTSIAGE